ncbi:enolase C-terminal domain-like protein [Bradyrhizobium guangdongense]
MLAAEANQGWSVAQAMEMLPRLAAFDLRRLGEPIRADHPREEWHRVRAIAKMPIVAGENFSLLPISSWPSKKMCSAWFSPTWQKGRAYRMRRTRPRDPGKGKTFCPHYPGGGIGLLASAHLLAAVGGDGWVEVDANDNPLRDALVA